MLNHTIELSPIEATAFWWINIMKNKTREISLLGTCNRSESQFADIFYYYTDTEWRNLYIHLTNSLTETIHHSHKVEEPEKTNFFKQATNIGMHDSINRMVSQAIGQDIPDIRLSSYGSKDTAIYTNLSSTHIWHKYGSMMPLPTTYMEEYILTGNQKELNFYNTFIATVAVLNYLDTKFRSIPLLRERFCEEYMKQNDPFGNIDKTAQMFDYVFEEANAKKLISGKIYQKYYFPNIHEVDIAGLSPFMEKAEHYANVILHQEKKEAIQKVYHQ